MRNSPGYRGAEPIPTGLQVDPDGARVLALPDGILLPVQMSESGSLRGGIHGCFPNFGKPNSEQSHGLKQHGFARDILWRDKLKTDTSMYLEMGAAGIPAEYQGLAASLSYISKPGDEPGSNQFTTLLALRNNSDHPLRLAPGFHPYFALPDGIALIDGEPVDLEKFTTPEIRETDSITLQTAEHEIVVTSSIFTHERETTPLRHFVIWTGLDTGNAPYICIEPTFAADSFAKFPMAQEGEELLPGMIREYGYAIISRRLAAALD